MLDKADARAGRTDDLMNEDKRGRPGGLNSRTNAWISLIVSALIVLVVASRIFEPHDYPAGDPRNEPYFWIVVGVFFLLVVSVLVVSAIRTLRRGPEPGEGDD
jgi:magnesium-transporting ATPase (P-type)